MEATVVVEGLEKFFRAQASKENANYRRKVSVAESNGQEADFVVCARRTVYTC